MSHKSDSSQHNARAADENMLFDCGGITSDARILIVREAGAQGYYSQDLAEVLVGTARSMGLSVAQKDVAFQPEVETLPTDLVAQMAGFDVTVFLARLGDQVRFIEMPAGARAIVSYVLDAESLESPFATAPYQAFVELKSVIEAALADADVTIHCAAGTEIHGHTERGIDTGEEVTVRRFPMVVPRPVPAAGFSGRVALCGFLTGTGTRYYEPYTVEFAGPTLALFADGRLTGFDGSPEDVARADEHYDRISARFGIDRNFVHSWHAGMHPACVFRGNASDDYARWGNGAFGNPRVLHFHTCGAYAPGEISWNVVDPTITVNGVAIWNDGRLCPDRVPGGAEILERYPEVAPLFDAPSREIGL